jgi:hypothetical protein
MPTPSAPFSAILTGLDQLVAAIESVLVVESATAVITQSGDVPEGTVRDHPEGVDESVPVENV